MHYVYDDFFSLDDKRMSSKKNIEMQKEWKNDVYLSKRYEWR